MFELDALRVHRHVHRAHHRPKGDERGAKGQRVPGQARQDHGGAAPGGRE